jgi:hypothetical protein
MLTKSDFSRSALRLLTYQKGNTPMNNSLQMTELTEDELSVVAGSGGLGFDGGLCSTCGLGLDGGFGACGACGFTFGPFIAAYTNYTATTFAAQTSVQFSQVNQTAYFTQFG